MSQKIKTDRIIIKRWIEYLSFLVIISIIKILPLNVSYFLGSNLGRIAYIFLSRYRRETFKNLKIAFPNYSEKRIKVIAKETFQNFGKSFIEFLHFSVEINKENIKKYIIVEGINYLKEAWESKKGIVIFSGHLGNWEVIPLALALWGYPMSVLVKEQSNKYIDNMINKVRRREGVEVINIEQALRKIISLLQRGKMIGIVGDQSKSQGVKVNFFNKPITVPSGAASFAKRYQAVLLPTFDIREDNNKHRLIIEPPLIFSNQERMSLEEIMSKLMKKVEEYVRKYPEQWIWWYRQWEIKDK